MEQQPLRRTFTYQLLPTPTQEQTVAAVVWRCRELYNASLEERKTAWEQCGVSVTFAMQSAQLPAIKEVSSDYPELNAQAVQDVLHRWTRRLPPSSAACRPVRDLATRACRAGTATPASPLRRSARTVVRWCLA
jgi:transposase